MTHLLRAARVEPGWQATWYVLSVIATLNGNYDCAERFADRLMQPNDGAGGAIRFVGAEVMRAILCLRRGECAKAISWLAQSSTQLNASDHVYREGMMALTSCVSGDLHLRQGNAEQALVDYRQAWHIVQEYPTMVAQVRHGIRALAGLAASYSAGKEPERAADLLRRATEMLPTASTPQSSAAGANLAELHYALAAAHARNQNVSQAILFLESAFDAGWRDAAWLDCDPELQPLRNQPGFLLLCDRLRKLPDLQLEI